MCRVQSAELDWAAADTVDTADTRHTDTRTHGRTDARTYAGVTTVELETKVCNDFKIMENGLM